MKKENNTRQNKNRERSAFSLCRGCLIYLILLIAAVIFTQALRSPVSAAALVFVLLLPVFDLLTFLPMTAHISASVSLSAFEAAKGERCLLYYRIRNGSLLPLSTGELRLRLPDEDGILLSETKVDFSLPPFGETNESIPLFFRYRGVYPVGTEGMELYDLFHLFRVRKRFDRLLTLRVLPDRLPVGNVIPPAEGSGENAELAEAGRQDAFGEVREYRPGDSIKSIHWKLSTKTDELLSRKPIAERGKRVRILCRPLPDLCFGDCIENAFRIAADRTVEVAYAVAREAGIKGLSGELLYPDGEKIRELPFSEVGSTDALASPLAEALPIAGSVLLPEDTTALFLLVTGFSEQVTDGILADAVAAADRSVLTLCLCDFSDLLPEGEEREKYRSAMQVFLDRAAASGVRAVIRE